MSNIDEFIRRGNLLLLKQALYVSHYFIGTDCTMLVLEDLSNPQKVWRFGGEGGHVSWFMPVLVYSTYGHGIMSLVRDGHMWNSPESYFEIVARS